jgi:hypothetical protein
MKTCMDPSHSSLQILKHTLMRMLITGQNSCQREEATEEPSRGRGLSDVRHSLGVRIQIICK